MLDMVWQCLQKPNHYVKAYAREALIYILYHPDYVFDSDIWDWTAGIQHIFRLFSYIYFVFPDSFCRARSEGSTTSAPEASGEAAGGSEV